MGDEGDITTGFTNRVAKSLSENSAGRKWNLRRF
jgi:hypothetical protein